MLTEAELRAKALELLPTVDVPAGGSLKLHAVAALRDVLLEDGVPLAERPSLREMVAAVQWAITQRDEAKCTAVAELEDAANRMRARLNTAVDELAGARKILATIPRVDRTLATEVAYERLRRTWQRRSAAWHRLLDARDARNEACR